MSATQTPTTLLDEAREVLTDLTWLDRCRCPDPLEQYFVQAGRVISEEALNAARACPARRQELIFAYTRDLRYGYFGGMSPGQRNKMTLEQALEFIVTDLPKVPAAGVQQARDKS